MSQKKTLFNYLHDTLVLQITSGKLAYGERLPAIRSLCGIYSVGIRTVRDVMQALVKEGYVETVNRSHMQVAYRGASETPEGGLAAQAAEVLARRDSVQALQKMKALIIPHIYAEASKLCGADLIKACRNDVKGIDALSTKEKWRRASVMLQRLVSVYNNTLLQELCIDMDLFAQVAVLPGYHNPYDEPSEGADEGLGRLLDMMAYQDYNGVFATISQMYADSIEPVERYYDALQADYPGVKPEPVRFEWNAEKGRIHTYMAVARDIIKKIGDGVYADSSYLPTNSQLREEYRISAYTVGKTMEVLEVTGLVKKTMERGGYLITIQNARAKELFLDGTTIHADSITFLSAMHITALLSKGLALLGYDYLDDEMAAYMKREVDAEKTMTLPNGLLATLVKAQPYEPLKAIYAQLENLMMWGYYFAFARQDETHLNVIREKCRIAVGYIHTTNKAAFADMIQNIYYYVFNIMRDALYGFGVADAKNMKLP
jgi:DNA-binding GntR family transcriptional regulator